MASPGTWSSYNGGGGTTTTATPATATNGTTPFPTTQSSTASAVTNGFNPASVQSITQTQFLEDYSHFGVSSSNVGLFFTGGKLNNQGLYMAQYASLSQADRQAIQEDMAAAGLITPSATNADGTPNSTSNGAFIGLLGRAASQGFDPYQWLQSQGTGYNAVQNQISTGLATAEKNATAPVTATLENPTTLTQDITTAFDNALGYAPSEAQIKSFIGQIQGQDVTNYEAPRAQAQQQVAQAQSEESALNQMGPDGINTVLAAYAAAVKGTKLPGAGSTQGPAIGATYNQGAANNPNPAGVLAGPYAQVSQTTGRPAGVAGAITHDLGVLTTGAGSRQGFEIPGQTPTTTQTFGSATGTIPAPSIATPGTVNTTTQYGGVYALSAKDWSEAKKLLPNAKLPATPGQASAAEQEVAAKALLQQAYDNNGGNWAQAVTSVAGGSPLASAEGSHLSAFASNLANEVDSQIKAVQNQVNNSTVTTKVTAPDATAEAAAAAKAADPVGYYAANYAGGAELLNQMLAGAPLMYSYNNSDTFSGPVPTAAAAAPPAAPAPNPGTVV